MKSIVYISIFLSLCSFAAAQDISQGQLYAEPNENMVHIDINKPLSDAWIDVDNFVTTTNSEQFVSYKNLAIYLTDQFGEQQGKARSLYTWIAMNISYDHTSVRDANLSKKQDPESVWKSRTAVCEGFANLFNAMCKEAGLESRMIKGYVKDFADMDLRYPNHAWNGVKIEGKWKLLDATWASVNNEADLSTYADMDNINVRHKLDHFFLVNPSRMIYTHMPEDPYWQLQNNYVSMDAFLGGKDQIKEALSDAYVDSKDFEQLISNYEQLDSLDKAIAYMERMEYTNWNSAREYGLGIAYYYKAQQILKEASKQDRWQAKEEAIMYYHKSLEQLTNLEKEDFGYEFSIDLANSVELRIASLQ